MNEKNESYFIKIPPPCRHPKLYEIDYKIRQSEKLLIQAYKTKNDIRQQKLIFEIFQRHYHPIILQYQVKLKKSAAHYALPSQRFFFRQLNNQTLALTQVIINHLYEWKQLELNLLMLKSENLLLRLDSVGMKLGRKIYKKLISQYEPLLVNNMIQIIRRHSLTAFNCHPYFDISKLSFEDASTLQRIDTILFRVHRIFLHEAIDLVRLIQAPTTPDADYLALRVLFNQHIRPKLSCMRRIILTRHNMLDKDSADLSVMTPQERSVFCDISILLNAEIDNDPLAICNPRIGL
jgi:hypothetical protein